MQPWKPCWPRRARQNFCSSSLLLWACESSSIDRNAEALHERYPELLVVADGARHVPRRAGAELHAALDEALRHLGRVQSLNEIGRQAVDDLARSAGRHRETLPEVDLELRIASSSKVGTSGSCSRRFFAATASTRTLPTRERARAR